VSVDDGERPIRIMLVGCGRISERHIDAITENEQLELVAVCDEVAERARTAGEKSGVPHFTSYEKMLKTVPADAVAICTPSGMHPSRGCWPRSVGCT
jgi:Predicted dehydrogenases and related proteins